jgi:hypothetical protein
MRMGDSGATVKNLQSTLNKMGYAVSVDGDFGPKTAAAVKCFQSNNELVIDGIVGPRTLSAMQGFMSNSDIFETPTAPMSWVYCKADKFPGRGGYKGMRLREDAAAAYAAMYEDVHKRGGIITTAGGKRSLKGKVTASRSKTSLHYVGRAFDLAVPTGLSNTATDPYLMVRDGDRKWTVWCRTDNEECPEVTLDACYVTKRDKKTEILVRAVTVRAFNFTAVAATHGFIGIPGRRSFFSGGSVMGAEWWHFSWRVGLEEGVTTFGEELLKVYTHDTVSTLPHWGQVRGAIYGKDFFG